MILKRTLYIFLFLNVHTLYPQDMNFQKNVDRISAVFEELEMIAISDNGILWGDFFYFPLFIVERNSRFFVSNTPLPFSEKSNKDNIYTGFLPERYIISNSIINIEGKIYTYIAIDNADFDKNEILETSIHEMFHYWQEKNNIHQEGYDNNHLETKWGRIYMTLEIKALQKSLLSNIFSEKKDALTCALYFRKQRHYLFPDKVNDETKFELAEGLAEYTGMKLTLQNDSIINERLYLKLDNLLSKSTFYRTFGYYTGAAYAILNDNNQLWKKNILTITNLADLSKQIYKIDYIPEKLTDEVLTQYNYDQILHVENLIYNKKILFDKEIREKIKKSQQIRLDFSGNNFGFNPNEIFAIEEVGTYFPFIEISGNFGKIYTRKGAVLNNNEFIIFCDENTEFEKYSIQDENINLNLNDGYYLKKQENIHYVRYKKSIRRNF